MFNRVAADSLDEYVRMRAPSTLRALKEYTKTMVAEFEEEFLRAPAEEDMERISKINTGRDFPGMAGSIDCQHYVWKIAQLDWPVIEREGEKADYYSRRDRRWGALDLVLLWPAWLLERS